MKNFKAKMNITNDKYSTICKVTVTHFKNTYTYRFLADASGVSVTINYQPINCAPIEVAEIIKMVDQGIGERWAKELEKAYAKDFPEQPSFDFESEDQIAEDNGMAAHAAVMTFKRKAPNHVASIALDSQSQLDLFTIFSHRNGFSVIDNGEGERLENGLDDLLDMAKGYPSCHALILALKNHLETHHRGQ